MGEVLQQSKVGGVLAAPWYPEVMREGEQGADEDGGPGHTC